MEREIKGQKIRMALVLLFVAALVGWQHEFVIHGTMANPYLNFTIFGTFGFAAYLAIRLVFRLKNDVIALNALQADFSSSRLPDDEIYKSMAIVFDEPELLGHAYRLITEELAERGKIRLATDTVHILVSSVESRIAERKAMIGYFSGLMVFLGLFGTFIGLMETVTSVSGILSALDFGGNKNADTAFAELIEGLKGPLTGMATGFSASLFGLGTSLILGLFERFTTTASRAVKIEFEGWLTNLSSLDGTDSAAEEDGLSRPVDRANLITARRLARLEAQNSQTGVLLQHTSRTIGELTVGIQALSSSVSNLVTDQTGTKAIEREEAFSLMEQQRALTANAAAFVTALADERTAAGQQLSDIRVSLAQLVEVSQHQHQMQAASWSAGMVDLPLDVAAVPGQVDAAGARGLLARLVQRMMPAQRPAAAPDPALVRTLSVLIGQQGRIEQVLTDIDVRRERDSRLVRASIGQQEQMLAVLTVLIERLNAAKPPEEVAKPLDELRRSFHQQHLALDIALRRLEIQLQQTQDMTHEAVATAREAVDVVTYKRASNS